MVSCAAAMIPCVKVVATDQDPYHVRHLMETSPLGNIEVRIEDVAQTHFSDASVSAVI